MHKRKTGHCQGFTLIEMIFVIVIMGIIAAIGARVIGTGFRAYFTNQNIVIADAQGRLAIERFIRDVHAVNSSSSFITTTSTQLSFVNVNGDTVTYSLSGNQLQRNGIPLADGISSLTFGYYDGNGAVTTIASNINYINITLGVTYGNVNYTLKTTVATLNYL